MADSIFDLKEYKSLNFTDRKKVAEQYFKETYTRLPEYKKLSQDDRDKVYRQYLTESGARPTAMESVTTAIKRGIVPMLASVPSQAVGEKVGAPIGETAGKLIANAIPPVGALKGVRAGAQAGLPVAGRAVGKFVGGLTGGISGNLLTSLAQDEALKGMPEFANYMNMTPEAAEAARRENPNAYIAGEILSAGSAYKPSVAAGRNAVRSTVGKTPEQKASIIGDRLNMGLASGLGLASEGYNQYQEGKFNPVGLAESAIGTALFSKQHIIGNKLESATNRLLSGRKPVVSTQGTVSTETPVVPEQVSEQNRILQEQAAQQEAQARGEQPIQEQPIVVKPIEQANSSYVKGEYANPDEVNYMLDLMKNESPEKIQSILKNEGVPEQYAEINKLLEGEVEHTDRVNELIKKGYPEDSVEFNRILADKSIDVSKIPDFQTALKAKKDAVFEQQYANELEKERLANTLEGNAKTENPLSDIKGEFTSTKELQSVGNKAQESVDAKAREELLRQQTEQRIAEEKLNELTSNSKSPLANTGGEVPTVTKQQAEVPLAKSYVADKLNSHINEVIANNPEVTPKELVDSIRQVAKENNYDKESVDNAIAHAKNIQQYTKESSAYSNKTNEISGKIEALANTIGMKAEDLSTTLAKATDDTLKESFGAKSEFSKEFKKTNKDGSLYGQIKKLQKELNKFNETKEPTLPETSQAELHKAAVEAYKQQEIDTMRNLTKLDDKMTRDLIDSLEPIPCL